jgi:hypothetical protein
MCAVHDTASDEKQIALTWRIARVSLVIVLVAELWPAALSLALPVAGFLLAREAIRIDPDTTGESILVLLLLAVGSALVLNGPWIEYIMDRETGRSTLDFFSLPPLWLAGASRDIAVGAWVIVIAAASWLTFQRESLWVQVGVLAIALSPMPFLAMAAWAMRNA